MLCYVVASPDRLGVDARGAAFGKPACIYWGVALALAYMGQMPYGQNGLKSTAIGVQSLDVVTLATVSFPRIAWLA